MDGFVVSLPASCRHLGHCVPSILELLCIEREQPFVAVLWRFGHKRGDCSFMSAAPLRPDSGSSARCRFPWLSEGLCAQRMLTVDDCMIEPCVACVEEIECGALHGFNLLKSFS